MKTHEIVVGDYYSDGKQGLRQVLSMSGQDVRYQIEAAKVEYDLSVDPGKKRSLIGSSSSMRITSFAAWAKHRISAAKGPGAALEFKARRLKLSPGEAAFMLAVLTEATDARAGTAISYDHTEGRAVGGLHRKGLTGRPEKGEVEFTELGAAYLRVTAKG